MNKDEQICALLKMKDKKGMKLLFDNYYRPLVLWSHALIEDMDLAEDIVQEFFIKIWENRLIENFEYKTLRSYLFVSVRNQIRNFLAKKDPLKGAIDLEGWDKIWDEYDDFEDEVIELVKDEIEKLPPKSREVLNCVYRDGMRYKEVAEKLKISVSTVNSTLVDALKKLRQKVSNKDLFVFIFVVYHCVMEIKPQN